MSGFLLALAVVSVVLAFPAFFMYGKKFSSYAVFFSAICAAASFALSGDLRSSAASFALVSIPGFALLFGGEENDSKQGKIALIAALLAGISFFTGCAPSIVPASLSGRAVSTGFIPSRLIADENTVYAARLGGTDVYAINPSGSEVAARFTAGRNVTFMILNQGALYTANKLSSSVSVINISTGKSSEIKTDLYTAALALDTENATLYAANMGESSVSVIDIATLKVKGKINTGKWPSSLYFDKKRKHLFIACKYTNTLEIFDARKGQMVFTEAHTGISPVAVLPVNGGLAVLNEWEYAVNGKGRLTLFDTDGYTVSKSIPVAGGISGGAVSKSGRYVYACVPLKDKVCVVDVLKGLVAAEINMPGFMPSMCAVSKDGARVYVGGLRQSSLEIINTNGMD